MSALDDEKLFYERFYALMGDRTLRLLEMQFGIGLFRRSSVLEGFNAFLSESEGFRGECCLEIGTANGLTAIVLSRYFKHVHSIDIAPNYQKHAVLRVSKITNVTFHDVRDNAEKAKLAKSLSFDGAYVDGDHARDTYSDFALVEHTRKVLFHEYWEPQPDVMKLVDSLRSKGSVSAKGKFALWIG